MPTTPLCADLGIEHPILSVGMGLGAGPELAAAVSNAGGLGVLGGGGNLPPELTRERIEQTRSLTRGPFGVNVIIDDQGRTESAALIRERFDAVLEHGVAVVVLFAGDPAPFVEPAHAAGTRVSRASRLPW